jgi:hypothetical protein
MMMPTVQPVQSQMYNDYGYEKGQETRQGEEYSYNDSYDYGYGQGDSDYDEKY